MVSNKNNIIPQSSDYSSSSTDEYFYISPGHLSSTSRMKWTPQHERKMGMFPLLYITSTNAGAACLEYSSGVLRHEVQVSVSVCMHEFLDKIPQSAPHKDDENSFAGREVVRKVPGWNMTI